MNDFINEIQSTETHDLLLILKDQSNLYTEQELVIIKSELEKRNLKEVSVSKTLLSSVTSSSPNIFDFQQKEEYKNVDEDFFEKDEDFKRDFINHLLTTGYDFQGYIIKKYLGIVSGETVLGTGFLSEFRASFSDFFGTKSNSFEKKLEEAKTAATRKLISNSLSMGGNALIGVDFDYITFSNNIIGIVANGTSVLIEKQLSKEVSQ